MTALNMFTSTSTAVRQPRTLPSTMIRILIADDHAIVRAGLKQFIADQPDMQVAGEAATGSEAIQLVRASEFDVVLLDISMPDKNGIDTLKTLKEKSPNFVGMKHAVNDLALVSQCVSALGESFKIFVGLEDLSYPMMAVGACGLMNAVGNPRPSALANMCEAVWRNDFAEARVLHDRLFEVNRAVFFDTNPIPMKYMMKRLGLLRSNEHRLPLVPATFELERTLDAVLERAGFLE